MKSPPTFKTERRNLPASSFREKYHAELEDQLAADREKRRTLQEKQAPREYHRAGAPKYEYERRTMTPIDFAVHVLTCHGLLHLHHGHPWLDGQYATPARKVEYANAILEEMKLARIELGKRP